MSPAAATHLETLEDEAVFVLREVAGQFARPALLFSGGKDSALLLHLAVRAFAPMQLPFPLLHVATGHDFPETLAFRDRRVAQTQARLVVANVQTSIESGRVSDPTGPRASRNGLQSVTLLDAVAEHGFDALVGGGRRDEEKARAKERVFSLRDELGRWNPRAQRPELWRLFNGRHRPGEHIRAFPLSDWTELDVWRYLARHRVDLPVLYFAHRRRVFERDGMLLPEMPWTRHDEGDGEVVEEIVRYRTVGDTTCTGAVRSRARTLDEVVAEVAMSRITERGATRADDTVGDAAMEDRKRQGYF